LCARRLGDLGTAGDGSCNLVFVDDVAAAAALALETPHIDGRIFNLGAAAPVPTWNEYFERYAQALGAVPVRHISQRRLTIERVAYAPLLKLAEIAVRLAPLRNFEPPPPIRPWLLELCRHRIEMDVHAAEEALGVRWTALDAGLAATAAWFHSNAMRP
jgi:nucleoside-diphosphate-sugar epimerase